MTTTKSANSANTTTDLLYNNNSLRCKVLPDYSAHDKEWQSALHGGQRYAEEVDIRFNWIV
jgi:hypothetical protein